MGIGDWDIYLGLMRQGNLQLQLLGMEDDG
jgi:hypothetical protein